MRRLSLSRRRKRNRLAQAVEKTWLRIVAGVWLVRLLLRRGRLVFR